MLGKADLRYSQAVNDSNPHYSGHSFEPLPTAAKADFETVSIPFPNFRFWLRTDVNTNRC